MKETFTIIILFLVCEDVFGDPGVKSVSVMTGDSVTLYTGLIELHEEDVIWWRFGEGDSKDLLAEIVKYKIWYAPGRFRDKLQISGSQTDLTIKNMKIKYSGLYEAEIIINTGTVYERFHVTVTDSPSVINAGPSEVASFTVKEGESVTLPCNVQTQRDDLIQWRFGDERALIAEVDMEDDMISLFDDDDERFRDRLKLNDQTGDLTITDCKSKHTGVYQLKISSNKQTSYKTFSVIVKEVGLSSGVTAGLCVFFLLVIAAIIAAAGLILYRRRISKFKREVKLMSVVEGESVTLHTYIELQKDAVVEWTYEDDELKKEGKKVTIDDEVLEGRFRDILKWDIETGSLTITKFKAQHAGLYEVKITRSKGTSNSKFNVYLKGRVRKGKVGESVTLDTGVPEIQRDEAIMWMFEDKTIAEYTRDTDKPTLYETDERFKNKLEMNSQTGDLTIKNIRTENTGEYKVQIKRRSGNKERKFDVAFSVRAMKGGSVTLPTKVKINKGDVVEWTTEDKTFLVTGMNGDDRKTSYTDDVRFRDRLKMNPETGDLIITDIRQTDEGVYTLKLINTDGKITYRIFNVDVTTKVQGNQQKSEMIRTGKMGESVSLDTGVTKIQKDDEILWTFGDMRIARYIGGTNESTLYDYIDERFKDKLEVNHHNGDLTIRKFKTELTGEYKVQMKTSSGNKERKFNVAYSAQAMKGGSVTLSTKVKIEEGDEVEWTSKDKTSLVTGMNGDNSETSYTNDERFRDRLKMNPETGDLFITDIRQTDEGVYTLKLIKADGKRTQRIFSVDVVGGIQNQKNLVCAADINEEMIRTGKVWGSVTLDTCVNEIQKYDEIIWMFGAEDKCIAQYTGVTDKPLLNDYTDERFKDRLEMNPQTGDLTIRNFTSEHTGEYKVQIKNSSGNKERKFIVALYARAKGRSVTLHTEVKIQEGDAVKWISKDKITLITGMNGDDSKTTYKDVGRFRNRLKMNAQTGDLTIRDIRETDEGVYTLKLINTGGKITDYRIFNVEVTDSADVSDDSVEVNMPLLEQGADKPPQVPRHWLRTPFIQS